MTKAQGQDIVSGLRQSLSQMQMLASNHCPLQDMAQMRILHFFNNDKELAQMTMGQDHDIPPGHKQSLIEV